MLRNLFSRSVDAELTAGEYLSPEPLLQNPEVVRAALSLGVMLPSYAYALNNPIGESDSTGGLPNSLAARAMVLIARGDFAGAAALLSAGGYQRAADAVQQLAGAFDKSQQVAGPCFQVSQRIANALQQLGRSPVNMFVRTGRVDGPAGVIARQAADGTWVKISSNGIHSVIESNGRYYDAFSGPGGQTLSEFMATTTGGMSAFPPFLQ